MGARILVVDDSPTIGTTVAWALGDSNYAVEIVQDGLSVLNVMRSFKPDLVLLDIKLPHVDGFQLCEMLRTRLAYEAPIVMLSGLSSEKDIQRALDAGADDYLVKPVSDDKLLKTIARQLEKQLKKADV